MQSKAYIALLASLCLAFRADAFDFGELLGTVASTVAGVAKVVAFLPILPFHAELVPDSDYKARLLAVNALCQLETRAGIRESDQSCAQFGQTYYKKDVGEWGCGSLRGQEEKGYFCTFEPSFAFNAVGMQAPDIVFRRDQWRERGRSHGQTHCRSKNPILREVEYEAPSVVDDEIVPSFNTTSDFYAHTLVANVQKHAAAFEETLGNPDVETNGLITAGIVKALDLAGIRYPIGLRVCQLCKGTCNKLMPKSMLDTCKHQVCVGLLGGVKVTQGTQPSCSEISQP